MRQRPPQSIAQSVGGRNGPARRILTGVVLAVGAGTVDVRMPGGEIHRRARVNGGAPAVGDRVSVQVDGGAATVTAARPGSGSVSGGIVIVEGGGGSAAYAPSPHELSSAHHSGQLAATQAPWALAVDGSRTLVGNLPVAAGATVDGVDIDVFEDDVVTTMVRTRDMDLELMKMCFQSISWSQFSMYEGFDDQSKRLLPSDPSPFLARAYRGRLDNGGDGTPNRVFGFYSKLYESMTTVWESSSTAVGGGYLEDSDGQWFDDQYKGYVLVDSALDEFPITSCTESPRRLLVSGTPASGAYSIRAVDPAYMVAFCSYSDVTTDGSGYVKVEVTFDGGTHWQTALDALNGINILGGTVAIAYPGRDYQFRVTVQNDASGNGAIAHKLLVCTDPSIWQ